MLIPRVSMNSKVIFFFVFLLVVTLLVLSFLLITSNETPQYRTQLKQWKQPMDDFEEQRLGPGRWRRYREIEENVTLFDKKKENVEEVYRQLEAIG